jgi:hypothetical protein
MKIISTKVHGVLDYIVGVLLIAAPWIFNFAGGGAETWVPVILGAGAIVYSLLTNYEMRLSKTLSMKTHLTLDMLSGILLAASPWIFGFSDIVYVPHLVFGILELGVVLITDPLPRHESPMPSSSDASHAH